jgi:aminoglycoside phosphotransferase (APT) family kinase protein
MSGGKMHPDERLTDVSLVRRLLARHFPPWADLPIGPVESAGTSNALYRLGEDMVVRLPRTGSAAGQVLKEQRWLPVLAPHLPLTIPVPLAKGGPAEGYPWHWSVYRWLSGEEATIDRLADLNQAAADLAEFAAAMHRIDATDGPAPGEHNFWRGVPLQMRDAHMRAAISASQGLVDPGAVTAAWESALEAPEWNAPPVWIHGDLASGNLLAVDGRLVAVIDFGGLGVGDPACDLIVAWSLFSGDSRDVFRNTVGLDEAGWARGRGWALSVGMIALPYYLETNPVIVGWARKVVGEVLADHENGA